MRAGVLGFRATSTRVMLTRASLPRPAASETTLPWREGASVSLSAISPCRNAAVPMTPLLQTRPITNLYRFFFAPLALVPCAVRTVWPYMFARTAQRVRIRDSVV